MRIESLNLAATALLTVDLQNDFLHADGAYGQAGLGEPAIAALPARVLPVANALRESGGWYVSAQFTLVPGRGGEPFISDHLRTLRPFLGRGDFAPGAWGHQLVADLQPADITVEKVAYSAFYMSRMEFVLRQAGIHTLLVAGIVTNGGVASTVRAAHVRDFQTVVLEDGCGAFDADRHQTAIADLATVSAVMSCADAVALIERSRT